MSRLATAALSCLFLLSGCQSGNFAPPIPSDQIEPLLVLDLVDGTLAHAPEGVEPTSRRLVFRRIPSGTRSLANADQLNESGAVTTGTTPSSNSSGVWLCTHELSQAQWNRLAPSAQDPWTLVDPSSAGGGTAAMSSTLPAWGLDADTCQGVLSAWTSGHSGAPLRLPTSREWESAARSPAGSGLYGWGDDEAQAGTFARVRETASDSTGPRAITGHEALGGFLDMHGNVWEWVVDTDDDICHLRGGSWSDNLRSARCGNRRVCPADVGYALAGVRPVLSIP